MTLATTTMLALLSTGATAGTCEALVDKHVSMAGSALLDGFAAVVQCDKAVAEASYTEFMKASGDVETLVGLSMVAVNNEMFTPVWHMLDKVPYANRDDVAAGVGAECVDSDALLPFLQGAFYGLKGVQFDQWEEALVTCPKSEVADWLEGVVKAPPSKSYDDKYDTMTSAYIKRLKVDALPVLQGAAITAAGQGGPFNALVDAMNTAIRPADFSDPSADDSEALHNALIAVAKEVSPEQAALVADKLYTAGAEQAAASLLPLVYPDRVQSDGRLLYGVASVEMCDDEAIIHWASVTEPSKRWSIVSDVEGPARAFKAKLKCTADGDWPVVTTGEPTASNADVQAWADSLVAQWEGKASSVKLKGEKAFALD